MKTTKYKEYTISSEGNSHSFRSSKSNGCMTGTLKQVKEHIDIRPVKFKGGQYQCYEVNHNKNYSSTFHFYDINKSDLKLLKKFIDKKVNDDLIPTYDKRYDNITINRIKKDYENDNEVVEEDTKILNFLNQKKERIRIEKMIEELKNKKGICDECFEELPFNEIRFDENKKLYVCNEHNTNGEKLIINN